MDPIFALALAITAVCLVATGFLVYLFLTRADRREKERRAADYGAMCPPFEGEPRGFSHRPESVEEVKEEEPEEEEPPIEEPKPFLITRYAALAAVVLGALATGLFIVFWGHEILTIAQGFVAVAARVALWFAILAAYGWRTPYNEAEEIGRGNVSVAVEKGLVAVAAALAVALA